MAVIRVLAGSGEREIPVEPGLSLLKVLRAAGVYLPAVCGGQGWCGKCAVRVYAGSLPVTGSDRECFSRDQLEAGYRLACAAFPDGDVAVEVFETGEDAFSAVNDFSNGEQEETPRAMREDFLCLDKYGPSFARRLVADRPLSYGELREASKLADAEAEKFLVYRERGKVLHVGAKPEPLYAVAVDVGTTTLALALVDLRTGGIAGRFSAVNRQREFGGDVISRIQRANDGDLPLLSKNVREQIAGGIGALCREVSAGVQSVRKIAVAGNTTMLHLLLQLSCRTLGAAPFTPVTLDMVSLMACEIFDFDEELSCETVILPGISTYVGADITAGLLYAGIPGGAEPALFLDIGTNGEMALVYEGAILCTATAAGPAFEGGNIRWGTGSVPGAISRARFRDGAFECTTIGNRPPTGICGSAVIDIVHQGLKHGLIEPSGRLDKKQLSALGWDEIFLTKTEDGRDIVFCQKDVRELQLGKSAIRSGLDALLNHAGLGYAEIKTLYLAGGFGFNLNLESGVGIGLIPEALVPKVALIGNSALGGAVKFLLNPDLEKTVYRIVEKAQEFSLPEDRYFNDSFLNNINFGEDGD